MRGRLGIGTEGIVRPHDARILPLREYEFGSARPVPARPVGDVPHARDLWGLPAAGARRVPALAARAGARPAGLSDAAAGRPARGRAGAAGEVSRRARPGSGLRPY